MVACSSRSLILGNGAPVGVLSRTYTYRWSLGALGDQHQQNNGASLVGYRGRVVVEALGTRRAIKKTKAAIVSMNPMPAARRLRSRWLCWGAIVGGGLLVGTGY